jgi:integrase
MKTLVKHGCFGRRGATNAPERSGLGVATTVNKAVRQWADKRTAPKRGLKRANLPTFRLYDTRTHATMLLGAGVNPKIVSERLGHSSIVVTLDTYSHVLPNMQQEVAGKVQSIVFDRVLIGQLPVAPKTSA